MSWQQYVDVQLLGTGQVQNAAIIGVDDGATWAASPGFTVDQSEAVALVKHFKDEGETAKTNGIWVNKTKYLFIKFDDPLLMGKKGPTGLSIRKTNKALIVGVYGEGTQHGNCNEVVGKLGDYLVTCGL